jgi:hypothetical protein
MKTAVLLVALSGFTVCQGCTVDLWEHGKDGPSLGVLTQSAPSIPAGKLSNISLRKCANAKVTVYSGENFAGSKVGPFTGEAADFDLGVLGFNDMGASVKIEVEGCNVDLWEHGKDGPSLGVLSESAPSIPGGKLSNISLRKCAGAKVTVYSGENYAGSSVGPFTGDAADFDLGVLGFNDKGASVKIDFVCTVDLWEHGKDGPSLGVLTASAPSIPAGKLSNISLRKCAKNQVTVFSGENYAGSAVGPFTGDAADFDLGVLGFNDKGASVKIDVGCTVDLWEHGKDGPSLGVLTESAPSIPGGKLSNISLRKCAKNKVTVYDQENFAGSSVGPFSGDPADFDLGVLGFNDKGASVKIE